MCSRCKGHGLIKSFMHVEGGVCFRCWGSGDENHPYPRPKKPRLTFKLPKKAAPKQLSLTFPTREEIETYLGKKGD